MTGTSSEPDRFADVRRALEDAADAIAAADYLLRQMADEADDPEPLGPLDFGIDP